MLKIRIPPQQRFILDSVSWERYTRLLRMFSDRHFRMTFDRGILEIMTLSFEHEGLAEFLNWLILTLAQEIGVSIKLGGSTTFRRKRKQRGLEPDNCYWIANEAAVRGKKKINLRLDPPPDLAIEVDISRSSLDRMAIYAKLRVPEVWRFDAQGLAFFALNASGQYDPAPTSPAFPQIPLTAAELMPFLQMRDQMDENAIMRRFRAWIQSKMQPTANP